MDETEPNNQTETRQLTGLDTPLAGPRGERCRARHPMILVGSGRPQGPALAVFSVDSVCARCRRGDWRLTQRRCGSYHPEHGFGVSAPHPLNPVGRAGDAAAMDARGEVLAVGAVARGGRGCRSPCGGSCLPGCRPGVRDGRLILLAIGFDVGFDVALVWPRADGTRPGSPFA